MTCEVFSFLWHRHQLEGTDGSSVSSERHGQSGINGIGKVPKRSAASTIRTHAGASSPVNHAPWNRLLRVFYQQHVSNQSIRECTKQSTASSLLRQRRLRWFGYLHRMPSSLPVRRVFDFNPNIHGW